MEDLLKTTVPTGGFKSVEDLKATPIPDDDVLENIRQSLAIEAPVFKKQPRREGTFIFVAGGSSLLGFLDELRDRNKKGDFICTSNMTHDFLIENGIIPDACMVIDPKERVKDYIKMHQKTTTYFIGTVCNPQVAKGLLDAGCHVEKMLVAYGMEDDKDIKLQIELYKENATYNFLVGGTMAGLRAMPMALLLGFPKIEYYGFDSCFSNNYEYIPDTDPRYEVISAKYGGRVFVDVESNLKYVIDFPENGGFYYAYKKTRSEDIQIAETPDGKRYLTCPVFAHQAKQFVKWADRMEGKLDVVCHGDNLSTQLLKCHREALERSKQNVGDKRWSDSYARTQVKLHETRDYGEWGESDLELVGRSVVSLHHTLKRKITILDYGCGSGNLGRALNELFNAVTVTNYDPFMGEYSVEPDGLYDISTCFDVMEHVEYPYVENTLKYIAKRTKYMTVFSIALCDAIKMLEDGRNAHVTQKSGPWWLKELAKYFVVVEAKYDANNAFFVCQAIDAKENIDNEKRQKTEQREGVCV